VPQTPHDALFKATFSKLKHARPMLRSALPAALSRLVSWRSLKREPGSFVDEALREQHTDLLFSATMGKRTANFYLLFEHQSSADPWMMLRLLQYMLRIWQEHVARHPGRGGERGTRLPVIVPVLLHHSETGWTCATAFEDLMDLDDETRAEALPYVPRFQLVLDDVSHATDDELRARAVTALGKLVLACFRHARDMRSLLGNLRAWGEVVREVRHAPHGLHAFARVLRYMFQATEDLEPDEVRALVEGATEPEVVEEIVSLAEKLRQQGLQEGLQDGLQKGRQQYAREVVLKLLRLKFGRVPAAATARVRAAAEPELNRWAERVLTAGSVAEVLGD